MNKIKIEIKPQADANGTAARVRPDTTDLERRVLAHERILQALIAHMAETEPRVLERLSRKFCIPMEMVRHEHDHTDADEYAEAFVRSIVRPGESANGSPEPFENRAPHAILPSGISAVRAATFPPNRPTPDSPFRITRNGGVWRVKKGGTFYADFACEEHALAAVSKARGRQ